MNNFRQILIFLSVLIFSPSLFGQSLQLVEGDGFAEGTVEDVNPLAAHATFKNVTEQPIWFKIFMLTEGITEGHTAALCWEVCYEYTDQNFESPQAYSLEALQTSYFGDFSAYLQPYKYLGSDENLNPIYSDPVPGESLISFEFVNTSNAEDVLVYEVLFRVLNVGNVDDEAIEIVKIAPNPASYFVGITLDEVQSHTASKIEIYDSIGNLVGSVNMMGIGNYANINVSSLSQGIYHLNLVNTDGSRSKFRTIAIQR